MIRKNGYRQAERETGRNAERGAPLAERCIKEAGIRTYVRSPREA